MSVKQISVFLENKPGTLAEMTRVLADSDIDMRAFSLAETSEFGIARIIVDDVYKTVTVLKEAGCVYSLSNVLAVAVPDVPGGLHRVLRMLADGGVNVEYMYAFLSRNSADAYMIFKVADEARAAAVLTAQGVRLAEQEELSEL